MARNVEMRDRVGGVFDHFDSLLYPKTHINMVEGLLTNGKLVMGLIPDGLKTGLKYAATHGANTTTDALLNLVIDNATNLGLDTAARVGSFIVASPGYTLTVSADSIVKGDDGVAEVTAGGTIVLETNDWVVYRGNFTSVHVWDVINNTHGLATTTAAGLMSASNVTKLNAIAENANNYTHPAHTARSIDTDGVDVLDTFTSDGTGHVTAITKRTLPNATTTVPGIMSAADKLKLDNVAANANNYVLPTATAVVLGGIKVGSRLSMAAGVLSADDQSYTHPTHTSHSIDATAIETIDVFTSDAAGHVTNITKQTIRTGTTAQTGVLQLATGTELTTALSTAKAVSPSGSKSMLDYFLGMKRYGDLLTANAASHPDGTIVLVTVT